MSPSLRNALLVGAAFFVLHLVLLLGTFDAYDLEETEYGNVAVAMMDGHLDGYLHLETDPSQGDALASGAGRRRRTVWSVEPLVYPFFALFGPTMLALKLFSLAGSALWAVLWFLVARRLVPRLPPWMVAALFVLPLPLVQRAALSTTSITAHLGSSLWHAAALLLVLVGLERPKGLARHGLLVASGLVAGWGMYCSFSLAPLLVGVAVLVLWSGVWRGGLAWTLGTTPGLVMMWLFRDPSRANGDNDLVVALTGLSAGSGTRSEGLHWADLGTALMEGPGFGRVDPETLSLTYLSIGIGYSVLVAAILVFGTVSGRGSEHSSADGARRLVVSLLVSGCAYGVAMLLSGFQLDPGYFDGLRYLLPLSPLPALAVLWAAQRSARPRSVLGVVLVAHAVGFVLLFRPAAFPAPWHTMKGYEPWVMKAWLQGDLEPSGVAPERLGRWALWAGNSAARQLDTLAQPEHWADRLEEHGLSGAAATEYWRGFGFGLALRQLPPGELPQTLVFAPTVLGEQEQRWLWQGAAMSRCYVPGERRDTLFELAPEANHEDLWYGLARAEIYCRSGEVAPPEYVEQSAAGRRDSWDLDYSAAAAPVSDEFLGRLLIY